MVSLNLLFATEAGLGNGETAIFPISVFKVKEGVNYNPGDKNYDIFKEAIKCSAKRLFPNFVFIDAPHNIPYYVPGDPDTEAVAMGCVDGGQFIKYKINGQESWYEPFERAWEYMVRDFGSQKYGISEYVDTEKHNITVIDSYTGKFVKVKKFIRNPDQGNWYKLVLATGRVIHATADHPFHVLKNGANEPARIMVKDINVDDILFNMYNEKIPVKSIEFIGEMGQYSYDVETESDRFDVSGIMSHNCRTRVISNAYDPTYQKVTRRGNLSFTSINLPRLGIKAKGDITKFYKLLDETMYLVKEQLLERMKFQGSMKVKNFPFLMGQGLWKDSEFLNPEDTLEEVIKHGSLSIGSTLIGPLTQVTEC